MLACLFFLELKTASFQIPKMAVPSQKAGSAKIWVQWDDGLHGNYVVEEYGELHRGAIRHFLSEEGLRLPQTLPRTTELLAAPERAQDYWQDP